MSLRILFHSNSPLVSTGYGIQARRFVPRLKAAGHGMAISCFYGIEGSMLGWIDQIPLYPKGFDLYGNDILSAHARHWNADIVLSLMDAWVLHPEMMAPDVRWVPWYPVDMEPLPLAVKRNVAQAWGRIVMTRFGEQMTRDAGLDCWYVPHGVETDVYAPTEQSEARTFLNFPADAFIVGMVAANKGAPSRKAFMPQLRAFRDFKRAHPERDIRLYLHTTRGDRGEYGGENLPEFLDYLGLTYADLGSGGANEADVLFCSQYLNILGFHDAYMRAVYSGIDVLLSVSMGEGFGVPILEAQSCGTPVIVGGWTAMDELCWAGWTVPKTGADEAWLPLAGYQFMPRIDAITEQLETAFDELRHEKRRKKLRLKARNGALDYDCDRIVERYWAPVLAEVEERIAVEQRSVHPVPSAEQIAARVEQVAEQAAALVAEGEAAS